MAGNFDDVLESFLDLCIEDDSVQWNTIPLLFENSDSEIDQAEFLVSSFDYITSRMKEVKLSDESKIWKLMDLLLVMRDPVTVRDPEPGENFMNDFKKIVNETLSAARMKRRESSKSPIFNELNFEHFSKVLYRGDVQLMKIFLRFGIQPPPRKEKAKSEEIKFSPERRKINGGADTLLSVGDAVLFDHAGCNRCRNNTIRFTMKRDTRRAYFVAAAMQSAFSKGHTNEGGVYDPDVGMCHRLYFQVIPEPFVTFSEIEKVVREGTKEIDRQYWDTFLEKYKKEYPESLDPYQPRSLLHLSRCQLRYDFLKIGVLPNLVSKLEIPIALKRLILADTEDFIR